MINIYSPSDASSILMEFKNALVDNIYSYLTKTDDGVYNVVGNITTKSGLKVEAIMIEDIDDPNSGVLYEDEDGEIDTVHALSADALVWTISEMEARI